MRFITHDFLLHSSEARELYHNFAADLPIIDYHTHLPPQDVAENRRFANLSEIWLEGDHYKWRAMRSNGIDERRVTGDASPYEKYQAWAATVPHTLRNPLYHWSHLELKRYFGIDDLVSEATAESIWKTANEKLQTDELSAHGILKGFNVKVVCTTDDPTDSLEHHQKIRDLGIGTRIYPTFRPDKALNVDQPEAFNAWIEKLEAASGVDCTNYGGFLEALGTRHQFFHDLGCRLSDHGLEHAHALPCTDEEAAGIYDRTRTGIPAKHREREQFATMVMLFSGHLDAARGWTKQLHLGPIRNNRGRILQTVGPDAGCDSIGDTPQAKPLSMYLDMLDQNGSLPKVVLYNINPADNYVMASMIGNFQDGSVPGKIQFGSGWWFADQKEGMEWQLNALSSLGLLSRFVGMLTDSRSFLSYPRHEYFRRILCNLLGNDMAKGELPNDMDLVGGLVRRVCYENAASFFGFDVPE